MLPVFKILASLRGLRGTRFDLFGLTAERRMERALISEFERLIDELLPALREDRLQDATLLVALYMKIRGYGPVKEESAEQVRVQVAQGLQTLLSVSREAA
jgi:indolepyruvate ferredoxin oxidoreductase